MKEIIVTTILALCLVSLAGAEGYQPVFEYSEEEAKLYRMPINQITPEDGIWTGHVIAYGHYIKPPYKIEVKDTIVLINNVQVYPALKTPGMIEKERKDEEMREARKKEEQDYIKAHQAEYNEMQKVDSLAKVLYEREKAGKGRENAINVVAKFYKKSIGVDSVRIIDDREILVCYSPGTIQFELQRIKGYRKPTHRFIELEPYPPLSSPPDIYKTQEERDEAMRKMGFPTTKQGWAEWWAERFEEKLKEGWAVTFWATQRYGSGIQWESDLIKTHEFLKDKQRSPIDKYNALRGIFSHTGILALIANFDYKEWNSLRRQR
ncbi:MAG TPA: hypothetical protein ENI34_04680 [candidate division WOR-3 bacterium]|uniref:Uncharacterized protein n=1 Tax=candidate division WOR-3 bacterium TaxID=2052148 RepID=A0A9C9ELP8_UNCW3|nr:hypothetical protein [candidate division WOR-3 bacterium]